MEIWRLVGARRRAFHARSQSRIPANPVGRGTDVRPPAPQSWGRLCVACRTAFMLFGRARLGRAVRRMNSAPATRNTLKRVGRRAWPRFPARVHGRNVFQHVLFGRRRIHSAGLGKARLRNMNVTIQSVPSIPRHGARLVGGVGGWRGTHSMFDASPQFTVDSIRTYPCHPVTLSSCHPAIWSRP